MRRPEGNGILQCIAATDKEERNAMLFVLTTTYPPGFGRWMLACLLAGARHPSFNLGPVSVFPLSADTKLLPGEGMVEMFTEEATSSLVLWTSVHFSPANTKKSCADSVGIDGSLLISYLPLLVAVQYEHGDLKSR